MTNNIFSDAGLFHFLIFSIILFLLGFIGIIISKNLIRILISMEIIMNAVCINFAAISKYTDGMKMDGVVFSIFISMICFVNAVIIIAIIINIFKHKNTMDIEKLEDLKG